jgi:Ca2+-binding RTX toxin-like protein
VLGAGAAGAGDGAVAKAGKRCHGKPATIVGGKGNDKGRRTLLGTGHRDVIVGRRGDDAILALGGADIVCGGPGRDFVKGGDGRDKVSGEAGDDLLLGGDGNDRVAGNQDDDRLGGQDGRRDVCSGGTGHDLASKENCERIRSARGV